MFETIALPDGRLLDLYVSGPESGLPLLFHHGTPGARLPERAIERAAHARGLRYVCASRPGYENSTRRRGRRVTDVVGDAAAVLSAVGARECVVAGHSGGGPDALACAAGMDGVRATLVIAGVGPSDVPELDFTDGMGEENIVELGKAAAGEEVLRPYLEEQRAELVAADVQQMVAAFASVLPEVDRAAMNDEVGADLVAQISEGLRHGVDGWVDDDLALTSPWGFSLDDVVTPVTLWQGDADLMVPFAHGQWLAAALPRVDANLLPGEGHLSIAVGAAEQMLDSLLALA
jgi:pimeloyl-ACP methyl ester carboxylesterase